MSTTVHKSAQRPAAADQALERPRASLCVVDVAVAAAEFPEHPNPQLKVAIVLEAHALDARWQSASGRTVRGAVARGSSSLMPARMPYATHWRGGGRMLLMSFSPNFLQAHDDAVGMQAGELRPAWSQSDPLLAQLGLSAARAQASGLATTTYMDAVAEVAMVHLVQRYGAGTGALQPPPLLGEKRLADVIDLIESHLHEDLPQARLAAAAGLSTYGFARAFTRAVGEAPHRYILRRRCERARDLLAHSALSLIDIAGTVGFSSQAHLTTAFRQAMGTTPARYRAGLR